MYEIILRTWYQEIPDETNDEVCYGLGFERLEDACEYLGQNYEKILDWYPVEAIKIQYNPLRKNV